ncbi:MAG: hypothetical protein V8Q86_09900 [Blautia sp.]
MLTLEEMLNSSMKTLLNALKILKKIIDSAEKYQKMKDVAEKKGMETFSYNRISEKAIGR